MVKQIRRRAAGRTLARMMVRVGILPSIPGGGGKEGYMDSEGVGLLRQVTLVVVGGREGWREKLGCCNVTEMHDVYRIVGNFHGLIISQFRGSVTIRENINRKILIPGSQVFASGPANEKWARPGYGLP